MRNGFWRTIIVGCLMLAAGRACGPAILHAATSSSGSFFDRSEDASDSVDVGRVTPIEEPRREAIEDAAPRGGNPLWSIPLSELSATRERPIFLASRRPLPRAVASAPVEPVAAPQVRSETDGERPPLALIGTVVGDGDAIAVFVHQPSQAMLRLRSGDLNAGWSVASVVKGEVVLTRAGRAESFILPPPASGAMKAR